MVQLRASLEALVLQAWRDRWSEVEWSVNLKAALAEDASELNKLCGLLLKQATLSEVPNKLMFHYLSYTVAAQVVSHTSLLEAVANYKDFHREMCIESMLDLFNFVRERLRCNSADAFQCEKLCGVLLRMVEWLVDGVKSCVQRQSLNLLRELLTTLIDFIHNPFITLCLYFNHLEQPDAHKGTVGKATDVANSLGRAQWVPDHNKNDFRSFVHKFASLEELELGGGVGVDPRELNPAGAHPALITMAALFGSVRVADSVESVSLALHAAYRAFRLPWWLLIRDFLRGGLLLQLDPGPNFPESSVTAFVYLKIPRVLRVLVQNRSVGSAEVVKAVEAVAGFHALLNSLDIKARSNCFQHLLEELKKQDLCTDAEAAALTEVRNRDKISFTAPSPGSGQPGIVLVLKAEPTFQTLIRSFHSEFVMKQDKLVQMMYHMITGKSFEFICAAAAATNRLEVFTAKLLEFNCKSLSPTDATGQDREPTLRSTLFDLSFLLLSKIVHVYSAKSFNWCHDGAEKSFFEKWCDEFLNPLLDRQHGAMKVQPDCSAEVDDCFERLRTRQPFWDSNTCDWGEVCCKIPGLGQKLLEATREHSISSEEFKGVVDVLQSDVCGLVLCLGQWLVNQSPSEERRSMAASLKSCTESSLSGADQKNHFDRFNFMNGTLKRLLEPLLTPPPVPLPPFPWLIHCGRRQLPQVSVLQTPTGEHLKQAFVYALRQGWANSCVLSLVDRCDRVGEHKRWIRAWMEETLNLVSVEELSLACELCLGVGLHCAPDTLLGLARLILDWVLEPNHHHHLCQAPRGSVLSRFLVHCFLLAMQADDEEKEAEEPKAKVRRLSAAQAPDPDSELDPATALESMYQRFSELCEGGALSTAPIYFIASFLRVLAENEHPPARKMITALPPNLLGQIIRIDPKMISVSTILSLHKLDERIHRQRALQNLCLLRQLRAL